MTPLPLKAPADPTTIAITRHLVAACDGLGVPCLIVGATARVLILENVFGLSPGRATRDVDFAVAVDSWERFDALKGQLVATGHFRVSNDQKQRLHFHPTGIPVDLVPFGGIEGPGHIVAWPPDMAIQLSVVGYDDALRSSIEIALDPSVGVRVASLPGQALLKIQAWADRGAATGGKDAQDLTILMRTYEQAGEQSRIYEQGPEICDSLGWEPQLLGAHLLGAHARNLASEQTRSSILALIEDQRFCDKLELDMAREFAGRDDALEYAGQMLRAFSRGFADR